MKGIIAAVLVCGLVLAVAVPAFAGEKAVEKTGAMPPAGMHFLGMKGTMAEYCTCAADCKCKAPTGDATVCSCGKKIEKMEMKGKYMCDKCGSSSDKPGKCCCGADLKKVE